MCCDLHTHTTASDGSDAPSALVSLARESGLSAVAVTDHDTVAGLSEALRQGEIEDIEVLPGVELSVVSPQGTMHMLGYLFDPDSPELISVLKRVQAARAERNPKILKRLQELGYPVSEEELRELAGTGQVGRPHIARAMVARGYVRSVSQAFDRFLKKDAPAYVPKSILSPREAVEVIHRAGGVAVLAHPVSLDFGTLNRLEALIGGLVRDGVDGVECFYSEHTWELTEFCLKVCRKYGLVATGGSDYHGRAKPHIRLGKGRGELCVPDWCVEKLKERGDKIRCGH